jgi:hypothetical protein
MKHDELCELRQTQFTPHGIRTPSCQCGSRAFPLCDGCRAGLHTKHRDLTPLGDRCQCDLGCEEVA